MAGLLGRGGLAGGLVVAVMLLMGAGPVHAYRFEGKVCRFDSVGSYIGTGLNARSLSNAADVAGLNCPTNTIVAAGFVGNQTTNAATDVDAYRLNHEVFTRLGGPLPNGGTTNTPTDAFGRCRYVDMLSSTEDYFVPLGSAAEWLAFTDHPPAGVRVVPCAKAYTSDVNLNVADITGKYFFGPTSAIVGDRVGAFDGQSTLVVRKVEGFSDWIAAPAVPPAPFVKDEAGQRDLYASIKLPYWRYTGNPVFDTWPPASSPAVPGMTSHTFAYSCVEDISIDYCKRWSFVAGAWACVGGYASRCGVKWKSWTETFDIKARALNSDVSSPSWTVASSTRVAGTARPSGACCVTCSQIDADTCSCDSSACAGPPRITPVVGLCGAANHTTVAVQPVFSLCVRGNASAVSAPAAGTWAWGCAGKNGGGSAACMACAPGYVWTGSGCGKVEAGVCGGAAWTCSVGSPFGGYVDATHRRWSCSGVYGGSNVTCADPLYTGTWTAGACSASCGPGTVNYPSCAGGNGLCNPATRPAFGGACNLGACAATTCPTATLLPLAKAAALSYGWVTAANLAAMDTCIPAYGDCPGFFYFITGFPGATYSVGDTAAVTTGPSGGSICAEIQNFGFLCHKFPDGHVDWFMSSWSRTDGGCGSCFPPDTPALTVERGWQPISQIKVGEAVVTFAADGKRGTAVVKGQQVTPNRKLRMINGVRISSLQKVQLADGTYKRVEALKRGDVLVNSDDKPEKIKTLVDLPGMHTVYNLVFDSHDTPFLAGGVRVKDWE